MVAGTKKTIDCMLPYKLSGEILGAAGSAELLIGDANKIFHKSSVGLFHKNIYLGGRTRAENFLNTITGFTRGGAQVGAFTGSVAMGIPDIVLGQGTANPTCYDIRSEGVAGLVVHGAVDAVATLSEVPGAIIGGTVGIAAECATTTPFGQATCTGGTIGAVILGATTSTILSVPLGIAFAIARLPSLVVKGATTLVGGIVGAVIGFLSGSVRAIFNT